MTSIDLSGKVAVVTGGTKGIGSAITMAFRKAGCKVYATSRNVGPNDVDTWALDLLDEQSIMSVCRRIEELDQLDIFINNAGVSIPEQIDLLNKENLEKTLNVNLVAPTLLLKFVAKNMQRQQCGKIVNISSIAGIVAKNKASAYSSSKAALNGLTRAAAVDLAEYGILVNAVSPGPTQTEMVDKLLTTEDKNSIGMNIPLKRFADASEIANVVLFLSSNLNTYITGQNIVVDGGFTIT